MRWGLTRPFRIFNIRLENSFSVFPVFDPFFDPFWTPPKHPIFDPLDYAPPLRSFPGAGGSQGGYPGGLGGDLGGGGGYRGGYLKIPHFLGGGGEGGQIPQNTTKSDIEGGLGSSKGKRGDSLPPGLDFVKKGSR